MKFIPVIKAEFSASLLQSSVPHDPSEIILIYWFAAQEKFLIIVSVIKTVVLLHIFVENGNTFFQDSLINRSSKEQPLIEKV